MPNKDTYISAEDYNWQYNIRNVTLRWYMMMPVLSISSSMHTRWGRCESTITPIE